MKMNRMYARTLEIARSRLVQGPSDDRIKRPHFGTGGNFSDIFLWDTAFTAMWARYHRDELPVEQSLDNFYRVQDDDGHINRQYYPNGEPKWSKEHPIAFAPPMLAWAELELFRLTADKARLARVYTALVRQHRFNVTHYRADDGLFVGGPYGCGMDNLPRWPRDWKPDGSGQPLEPRHILGKQTEDYRRRRTSHMPAKWNRQGRWIDMSAQMAFNALCLREMATLLDLPDDAAGLAAEHARLAKDINERCWSEEHGFYFDLGFDQPIPRFHIGAYWTLIAEIVPPERVDAFVSHLTDERKFGRPVPVPSLAADDPDYDADNGDYWRGGVWPPTNYMVLHGLRRAGREELARRLAAAYYAAVETLFNETDTLWENLSPEAAAPSCPSGRDFCGWSGLAPVAIWREFLSGQPC